jgi:single-strand DNA-binding protein
MKSINEVIEVGRLVRDPELKSTQTGKSICNFSIAVNGYEDTTYFFNCISWNEKLNKIICDYAHKGNLVCVVGELQSRSWQDKSGEKRSIIEINVNKLQLLTPKKNPDSTVVAESNASPIFENELIYDNEIPF